MGVLRGIVVAAVYTGILVLVNPLLSLSLSLSLLLG